MDDIVSRLNGWRSVHLARGGELFEEAADDITRLRWRLKVCENIIARMNATHDDGSVQNRCTLTDAVAWAVEKKGYPPMFAVFNDWNFACRAAMEEYAEIVPLYRHPPCQDLSQKNFTLTEAEREAIRVAILEMGTLHSGEFAKADTLRNLLERFK